VKVFISYVFGDDNKRLALQKALDTSNASLSPIVVATRRMPGVPLAEKVMACIREADLIVPILTRASLSAQWVNQEIGFAQGVGLRIVPVVEREIVPQLKGFIHDQNDIPFLFAGDPERPQREAAQFRAAYLQLIEYLANQDEKVLSASIAPTRVAAGSDYTTTVTYRGRAEHGFFDNRVVHLESAFKRWNPDPGTFPRTGSQLSSSKRPGKLNGPVDLTTSYRHSTRNWPLGRYKIYVRLYSHLVPGEVGRVMIAQDECDLEVR
jgi:hypothetical protein